MSLIAIPLGRSFEALFRFDWHEACLPRQATARRRQVTQVAHYYPSVDALTRPMQVREEQAPYGGAE